MLLIETIGLGGFAFVLYKALRELPSLIDFLLGEDEGEPRIREAGHDDEDLDFDAAIRSIGGRR
jgi:hypothetical protein